jgi:hypothetical protein
VNPLEGFFAKFARFLEQPQAQKKRIIELVKEKTGILLAEKDFEIKNNIVYILKNPAIKSEIFMRKNQLLKELKSASIYDIR